MRFVDSCELKILAGSGGKGCVAFRREKYVPHGGPAGGDGGKGGDVVFEADPGLSTLLDLTYQHTLKADDGEPGRGKDQYGRGGVELVVRVPVGTEVIDTATNERKFDLSEPGMRVIVARGGRGGKGNIHFASSFDRAPRRAEPGEPGEEWRARLELKVMADVGLLGFPNVGKSTFIRAASHARPKVADYPFTTLTPHLGVVQIGQEASFVLADIPGLIPGASEGAGLGIRFLKHVERTRALLHLVSLDAGEGREPLKDYLAITKELATFDAELARRPTIVALSKADISEVKDEYPAAKAAFKRKGIELRLVSAATGEGLRELLIELYRLVKGQAPESWELPDSPELETEPPPAPAPRTAPAKKKPAAKQAPAKKKPAAKQAPAKKKPAAKQAPAKKKPAAKQAPAKKKPVAKASERKPARRR